MRRAVVVVVVALLLPASAGLAGAQPGDSAGRALLRRTLWERVEALMRVEMEALAAGDRRTAAAALAERHASALARAGTALDTVVFHTTWGGAELERLRRAYPGSSLLERHAARLAAREGRDGAALAIYARLLRSLPADAALQREYAALLERMGRAAESLDAYTRALELEPEDEPTFRALVRHHDQVGSLDALSGRIARLRLRLPDSRALAEREVELFHRRGLLAEAERVARELREQHQEGKKP